MASTLSAKKRIRQNQKCKALNRWRKRRIHDAVRTFEETLHGSSVEEASTAYRNVVSILDKVACKKTIHPNRAARKKSRLAKRLNQMKKAQG